MESTRRAAPADPLALLRRIDFDGLAVWLLGFGLIAYLGLNGGAYDPVARNQVGIAVWWIVLIGVAVGALPVRRPGLAGLCSFGLLAAYVVWTALSASWSDSSERSVVDLGRVATLLGVFALALSVRGSKGARRLVSAVGAGIVLVAIVALLSRLHPAWFPEASETAQVLGGTNNRLSYPLNYWNGLAILVAIGMPLILFVATSARSIAVRAFAAAALPAMVLTILFTFSRGGTGAAVLGVIVFLAFASDRIPKLLTTIVAGVGGAILVAAALQRDALENGLLTGAARDQGNEMLAMTLVVCAGVGLIQVAISLAERYGHRPAWSQIDPPRTRWIAGIAAAVAVVIAIGVGGPGKLGDAWSDFKDPARTAADVQRFQTLQGNGRYQLWESAVNESRPDPLTGGGSGTFEYFWAREGSQPVFVRDAHSLYVETLGELGVVGLLLLVGFLGWSFVVGFRKWGRAALRRRTQLAAALAGCAAFCLAAGFDWVWELAVIPAAFLLLVAALVTAGDPPWEGRRLPVVPRAITAVVAIAAMVAIAIPLASAVSIDESRDRARANDLAGALSAARTARNVQPYAATPWIQEALVLELQGSLDPAAAAAREATEREPTNWRTWLILSRIEAKRDRAIPAVAAYRRARTLNPRSALFAQ